MRILYVLSGIYTCLLIASCTHVEQPSSQTATTVAPASTTHTSPCSAKKKKVKNPLNVSFYTKGHPHQPYTIVGQESISKFNEGGNKRQEATIRDGMRELAAAMGGDAVIDIKHDAKSISGTVVAYHRGIVVKEG